MAYFVSQSLGPRHWAAFADGVVKVGSAFFLGGAPGREPATPGEGPMSER